jgi:hypothetical protein
MGVFVFFGASVQPLLNNGMMSGIFTDGKKNLLPRAMGLALAAGKGKDMVGRGSFRAAGQSESNHNHAISVLSPFG